MEKENQIKPVSPKEIIDNLEHIIPQAVLRAVNELLKEKFRGSSVAIKQKEIIRLAQNYDNSLVGKFFENHYLDFEKVYQKVGWKVSYHKPDRDESFQEYFEFSPKSTK